jgi:hypothetical protein
MRCASKEWFALLGLLCCGAAGATEPTYPAEQRPTRPVEFFRAHTAALKVCLDAGSIPLGPVQIASPFEARALLRTAPPGAHREWILLARQTLVAVCNGRLFDAVTPDPLLIADALTALHETSRVTMALLEAELDAFNHSGVSMSLPATSQR